MSAEGFLADFPVIKNGLVYLDNAATTQKPQIVIDAQKEFYETINSNVHRGIYEIAEAATQKLEDSRKIFADFINADPEEIIFTKSATEGLNHIANSIERSINSGKLEMNKKDKINIVVTEIEHHSNFVPWQQLCKRMDAEFRVSEYDVKTARVKDIDKLVDNDTIIASFAYMSNVSGLILDAKEIIQKIRKKNPNTIIVIDAAQAVAHMPIDVKDLDADFLVFSAHKSYGTLGVGVVYGKKDLLEKIEPFNYGGHMIDDVTIEYSSWTELPAKFEAGTLDAAGIIASAEAIKYISGIGFDKIMEIEEGLKDYLVAELKKIKGLEIIGHDEFNYGPVVSFIIDGIHPHDLATICDKHDICIRAGHHCAQPFMKKLGVHATSRASLSFYNSKSDIDKLIIAIKDAWRIINGK